MVYLKLLKYVHPITGDHQHLKILKELAAIWRDVAIFLGFKNSCIKSVENPGSGKTPQSCLEEIVGKWIENPLRMQYQSTWRGLRQLLMDCGQSKMADRLVTVVEGSTSTLHGNYVAMDPGMQVFIVSKHNTGGYVVSSCISS